MRIWFVTTPPHKTRNVSVALFWPVGIFTPTPSCTLPPGCVSGSNIQRRVVKNTSPTPRAAVWYRSSSALLPQRLRARRREDRHAETQLDPLGRLVSDRQVREIDMVDDLIAEFVALS